MCLGYRGTMNKTKLREYDALLKRITQIEGFLDNCTWETFTVEDARKCVSHIRSGEGWL